MPVRSCGRIEVGFKGFRRQSYSSLRFRVREPVLYGVLGSIVQPAPWAANGVLPFVVVYEGCQEAACFVVHRLVLVINSNIVFTCWAGDSQIYCAFPLDINVIFDRKISADGASLVPAFLPGAQSGKKPGLKDAFCALFCFEKAWYCGNILLY